MKLVTAIAGTTLLGLLSFTFPPVRNLSYRKGAAANEPTRRPWSPKHPRRRT
jgi:hypothetical protein